jgi:hypothetical protein
MIDMSVRQYDSVDFRNCDGQGFVLDRRLAAFSLEHSTVESDSVPIDVQEMAGARYLTGCACERDFQVCLPLCDCAALKQNRESLFIL